MSDNLNALKTKIASSKQIIARVVLHHIIKLANGQFKKLRAEAELRKQMFYTAIRFQQVLNKFKLRA